MNWRWGAPSFASLRLADKDAFDEQASLPSNYAEEIEASSCLTAYRNLR